MARRALGPASLAVVQAVQVALQPSDQSLLVACSGGADSLALAFAARHVAERSGIPHAAVVVDHGLQEGSTEIAAQVVTTLQGLGYAEARLVTATVDPASGRGLEAAAREARYRALGAEPPPAGGAAGSRSTVLLGHTRDDQAETVLLGLVRGSGTRSLAGMAPRVGTLLRPLLGLRRTVTEAVCAELGLPVWQDPQNTERRFTRVRVRHHVLPQLEAELGPGVADALARTAELARDDADLLDALTADADPGRDDLDCALLLELPRPLRRRLIRRWLLRHGAAEVSFEHVLAVEPLVTAWRGQGPVSVPGREVVRRDGSLHVQPPAAGSRPVEARPVEALHNET